MKKKKKLINIKEFVKLAKRARESFEEEQKYLDELEYRYGYRYPRRFPLSY